LLASAATLKPPPVASPSALGVGAVPSETALAMAAASAKLATRSASLTSALGPSVGVGVGGFLGGRCGVKVVTTPADDFLAPPEASRRFSSSEPESESASKDMCEVCARREMGAGGGVSAVLMDTSVFMSIL